MNTSSRVPRVRVRFGKVMPKVFLSEDDTTDIASSLRDDFSSLDVAGGCGFAKGK